MHFRFGLLLLLLTITGAGIASAQDDDRAIIVYDDATREITFTFAEGDSLTLAYPDPAFAVAYAYTDELERSLVWFLMEEEPGYYPLHALYTFDREANLLLPYEPCPGLIVLHDGYPILLDLEDGWTFGFDPVEETAHLCDTTTDTISGALPVDYLGGPFGWTGIAESPGGDYLLLIAGSDTGARYTFYSYNIDNGAVLHLGWVGSMTLMGRFREWIDDTRFAWTITQSFNDPNTPGTYVADLTVADSLERIGEPDMSLERVVDESAHDCER